MTERMKKEFFINNDGVVRKAIGYACEANGGYWWFPDLGFSSPNGRETEAEARKDAIEQCTRLISAWQFKLDKLK